MIFSPFNELHTSLCLFSQLIVKNSYFFPRPFATVIGDYEIFSCGPLKKFLHFFFFFYYTPSDHFMKFTFFFHKRLPTLRFFFFFLPIVSENLRFFLQSFVKFCKCSYRLAWNFFFTTTCRDLRYFSATDWQYWIF